MGRLSAEEQGVLQAASVVGMEFSAMVVTAALEADVVQVEEWCEALVRRHLFLQPSGRSPQPERRQAARYRFLHSLHHSLWYDRLSTAQRRQLHQRIGEREEQVYGARAGEIATELAVHFAQGRDYGRAVRYLKQAAGMAAQRYAYREAIGHLSRGLELLAALPDTPERAQQELDLQIALGSAFMAIQGYGAADAAKAYARARELCQQVEDTPQLFPVLTGLARFYLLRAELVTAKELGEQSLALAERVRDPALLLEAHRGLVAALFWQGELVAARAHLEQAALLYNPRKHSLPAIRTVQDPQVSCLSFAALVLWPLGYPDQALQKSQEALALAHDLSHPFSLAYALDWATIFHHVRREGQLAREQAEAALTLSGEQGFAQMAAMGTTLRGWALAEEGQVEKGIAQMREGLAAFHTTGAELGQPYYLALLAEAYGKGGQAQEGLSVLAEALAAAHRTGQRVYEAELYRIKGELLLNAERGTRNAEFIQRSSFSVHRSAKECFQQAITIARHQSARSLELRAVMSLARLWQRQGKKKQACQRLAQIYNWFTEGFDTADLQEAKTLLEELA